MAFYQSLVDGNNTTLAFLHRRDFQNAVVSSIATMTLCQELRSILAVSSLTAVSWAPDCVDQCIMLLSNEGDSSSRVDDDVDNTNVFVFDQGIALPSSSTTPGAASLEVVSTILVFNSALAHQLYAQEQHDTERFQTLLVRSKRLYELALNSYSDVEHNVLFQFAVVNNLAVIELQTDHAVLSIEYFEDLLSTLMVLVDRGCSKSIWYYLRGFLKNYPFQAASAPASAA